MDDKFRRVTIDGVEFKLGPDEEIESLDEFVGSDSAPKKSKEEKED